MVRHDAARKGGRFPPDRRIVVVQLQAQLSWFIDFGIVDLDLVGLGVSGGSGEKNGDTGGGQVPQPESTVNI
jgi:hypothetical protein